MIFEKFRAEDIELPFNQYDLNLKQGWDTFSDRFQKGEENDGKRKDEKLGTDDWK